MEMFLELWIKWLLLVVACSHTVDANYLKSNDEMLSSEVCSYHLHWITHFRSYAKKKKLLDWRNPTDPKIRPDPTLEKKKKKKKRPTDPKKSKTCDF